MSHLYINGKFLTQPLSGVQRYAAEIARHLAKVTTDFSVVTSGEEIQAGIVAENNIIKTGKKASPYWEQVSLPLFLRSKRHPLLLNLCNMAPVFYKNKIVCIHDISFIRNPAWFSTAFYQFYKFMIPLIINSSKHLITVSEFSRQEITDYYKIPDNKISVIPGGVTAAFAQMSNLVTDSFPLQKPFFLFVGSMDPRKNLLTLLRAFVKSGITGTDLIIVGAHNKSFNSDLTKELDKYQNQGGIHFQKATTDQQLAYLYKNAKALIIPSYYEGFGLPVIEALSVGCPVIAADIPVFREVAEGYAAYFDPTNIDELILLLKQSDEGNDNLKSSNSISYITEKYNWNISTEKLLNIINTHQ